ncbi:hypothetical protein EGW08_001586 [Elysia chlorotica]|uniref:Cell cycle checkpoint control protein RAD9A n=1 Tax=Elysia chlorotica TaxID=188477 RepID=A0A433UA83_ELYCH|nr:hypothetical protein EGW08_001586 [Elysia chlorotica]
MSFKCTIPGVSLKVFGRAIQSLSKIGDELYFEPREDGLFLRSVNSCRSAYACFQFSPSFFNHYVDVSVQEETEEDENFRCKIGMKSVMTVFRNLAAIDKTVEKCRISLNTVEDRLVFQMYCRHGIIKTHKLAFIECETLQAVSSKDMCPNKLTSLPKLLCDAVLNFQANQEEITLIVRPDFLALQNYLDDDQDATKVMRTELTLSPSEFDQYQVGVDTDITFCLKELRAILSFADITNLPVTLHFEGAGRPITFSITGDLSYEGNFVLATLADAEPSLTQNSQGYKSSKSSRKHQMERQSSHQNGRTPSVSGKSHQSKTRDEIEIGRPRYTNGNSSLASNRGVDEEENLHRTTFIDENASITDPSSFMQHGRDRLGIDNTGTKADSHCIRGMTNHQVCDTRPHRGGDFHNSGLQSLDNRSRDDLKAENVGSQIIPVQNADYSAMDEVEEDEEEVPATPPSKKFRSVFFGTQSSTQPSQSQNKAEILAPNSDEDD